MYLIVDQNLKTLKRFFFYNILFLGDVTMAEFCENCGEELEEDEEYEGICKKCKKMESDEEYEEDEEYIDPGIT